MEVPPAQEPVGVPVQVEEWKLVVEEVESID